MITDETDSLTENKTQKKRGLGYYWPFGFAVGIFALDQFTKWLTENNLGPYGSGNQAEILGGLVIFRYVKNTGASFSILQNSPWFFALVASLASIGIIIWYVTRGTTDCWYQFCVALLLAGAVGNLSDRLFKNGAVTDMINLPWAEIFKNFNVADVSLNVGVATLLLVTIFRSLRENRDNSTKSDNI
ncbi:MAG: signal peptidase II [Chloroflexi bacterium]|uniref:Lipoprotein signal peptidase n=1 Tax=Candidatus Chlorohelix allophototropha TaxID=3003348 RepID=A0A8T7M3L6_9CHLR|nr:signal peptidase II [Chloroflexota bacterium]WJW65666.1 signal peptidase II [Chloroflexota bacterium L227-S17]